MIEGNNAADLRRWCAAQEALWLEAIDRSNRIRKLLPRAQSVSTGAATSARCSGVVGAIPTMSCSAPGWPRSRCAAST